METAKAYSPGQENLTASDVLKLAGLTYKQLHDWERRAGVVESERSFPDGWRKFTFETVLALAICTKIREQLGIPLEKAGKIYNWLIGKTVGKVQEHLSAQGEAIIQRMKRDPITAAIIEGRRKELKTDVSPELYAEITREYLFALIEQANTKPTICALKIAQLGMPVYLLTDFEDSSMILSETQLAHYVGDRAFKAPTLIFPLNELLTPLMQKAKVPSFKPDTQFLPFRDYWDRIHEEASLSKAEKEMLRLIRERDYQRVTAHVKDGAVVRIETEEDLTPKEQDKLEKQILDAIRNGEHQTITLKKCNGKIVRINRTESIKLD